jgi:hypothetical protein
MTVAMLVDNPEGSQETYERVRERLGLDRPAGGIFHVAGPSPNGGWRVIEVWESEEDAKRFVERLRPAFEAVGAPAPPPPELWPVHNYMAQRREHQPRRPPIALVASSRCPNF